VTGVARILVADHDRESRGLMSRALERVGYTVYQAGTGEEAVAVAKRERPALVVVEVLLRGVSGYEVCHELKNEFGEASRSFSFREIARSRATEWPASS
jgi:two-component system, OmpR family, alkaline phosphatase synthesis response regulator PhoP